MVLTEHSLVLIYQQVYIFNIYTSSKYHQKSILDMTPVWHWNTHILFAFVVAEYESEANVRVYSAIYCITLLTFIQVLNQVVVWDKIVRSKKQAKLREKNEFVKYALIDQGAELRQVFS